VLTCSTNSSSKGSGWSAPLPEKKILYEKKIMPYHKKAYFRFYEELNDFLPMQQRKREFTRSFKGKTTLKDVIEATGVPHTEIDLILVDGISVGFEHILDNESHVSVYPTFESFDTTPVNRLRPTPLRNTKFILDVHRGQLARSLRIIGFDSYYMNNLSDPKIIENSCL